MFSIDQQLINDTHYLLEKSGFHLLLHKNASIPWIIIVPETDRVEVFDLSQVQQQTLSRIVKRISCFFQQELTATKMNIAAIGNIVSQLHIHVIGRNPTDDCWPNVVWGNKYHCVEWDSKSIKTIINYLINT